MKIQVDGVLLEITGRCNARCPYCYNSSGILKDIPFDDISRILMNLYSQYGRIKTLKISGGEPSLHPDWQSIKEFLKNNRYLYDELEIITNGNAFDYTDNDWLFMQTIQLTLESLEKEVHDSVRGEGNFVKINSILDSRKLYDKQGKLILRMNITKRNCSDLQEVVDYAINKEVDELVFSFLKYCGRAKDDSKIISCLCTPNLAQDVINKIDELKHINSMKIQIRNDCKPKLVCGLTDFEVPHISPVISFNGDVHLCEGISNSMSIGSIYNNQLTDLFDSELCKRYIEIIKVRKENLCNTEKCVWKYICPKGCAGESADYYGNVSEKVDICWYYRNIFKNKLDNRRRTANVDTTYE